MILSPRKISSRLTIFLILIAPISLFSQVKINSKAPEIIVTSWLTKNKSPLELKNKFIVLEFWATWCVPCIEALPHLNRLQNSFAGQSNLKFLSITDESLRKISSITGRFHFSSIILSDTTKATLNNFKINYLPTTILINDKGIVKWIGMPNDLSESLLNDFITDKLVVGNENVIDKSISSIIKTPNDSLRIKYTSVFYDEKTNDFFGMTDLNLFESKKSAQKIFKNVYNRLQIGVKIQNLFADLLETSLVNISLPDDIKNLYVSYCFKRDSLSSVDDGRRELLNRSLERLKLKIKTDTQLSKAYIIRVADSSKLKKSEASEKESQSNLSVSDDKKLISIHNANLKDLMNQVENLLGLNILLDFDSNKLYDITLRLDNFEELKKSLNYYGLSVSKEKRSFKKFFLEK
ncbi:redoxin domain-containing protein [Pedobacter psychrodurus]|uniref:Redoxin domain-containing protein n=1 Tax=Pedobacter psychrodurus TaxID=2530456 RepID=A0A4R0Q2Z3_9SPHI|nr:TlpA disulfide reductase family protein [Pedobacter psychrodurus]TCD27790.1 redoxin domain-containing protein [Pedobacter psychrodurus]